MSSRDRTISIRLPTDVVAELDEIATLAGTDRNTVICVVLATAARRAQQPQPRKIIGPPSGEPPRMRKRRDRR
ncbi:MAG: hypothetical protein ACRD3Q_20420 [Terriglobales bacterium]